MLHKVARSLLFVSLAALAFGLLGAPPGSPLAADLWAGPNAPERVVYLARDLDDEDLLTLGSAVAGGGKPALLLLDSAKTTPHTRAFLAEYKPDLVIPVGSFPEGVAALERRLAVRVCQPLDKHGLPSEVWSSLNPRPRQAVVCPAEPRGQLLQAACLAGALHAPLLVVRGEAGEPARLRKRLEEWQTREVYLVGDAHQLAHRLPEVTPHRLADEAAVATAHVQLLAKQGHVETFVIANAADFKDNGQAMSPLAPWVAVQKRAALLLTNEAGDNVPDVVRAALRREPLRRAENVIYVADLLAIPPVKRPNPIPGDKDPVIEMEPLTPTGAEPFTFAVGRLFHEDPAVVPLMLARQRLLAKTRGPRKALVASNPGGGLPLLETVSRNTAKELRNAGYETTALFNKDVRPDELRKLLAETDLFLWEGHHNTLVRDWGFPEWDEPMAPALVFLQSCLALKEAKVQPLMSRGAVAVVGSSTRTYSGSGCACSLAFFNALNYDDQSLGGSLRQAKNFLLAYALLKEKRLGTDATRTGANHRAAWAFTLWGDPTLRLPRPEPPENALPRVRHEVTKSAVTIELPAEAHAKVSTTKYQVEMLPNARLAGLLRKDKEEDGQPLVPFVFAEVQLPKGKPGAVPRLSSKVPSSRWVFVYDERRNSGYLLVTPRPADDKAMRFHVEWQSRDAVRNPQPAASGSGQ